MQLVINKSDFINDLANNCDNINHNVVEESVKEIFNLMSQALIHDDRIEVRGFGSFSLHHRNARIGRNPKTGEQVNVNAKAIPHFKPGKGLREAVDDSIQ